MSRELKQILEKLGEERDITKLYFIKAILIKNNNKEKKKSQNIWKTVLSLQGRWKSSLVLVPNIILFHVQLIFHGIVSFSLQDSELDQVCSYCILCEKCYTSAYCGFSEVKNCFEG